MEKTKSGKSKVPPFESHSLPASPYLHQVIMDDMILTFLTLYTRPQRLTTDTGTSYST